MQWLSGNDADLPSAVHLVGNYINQVPYAPESGSEYSGEDDYSELDDDEELDEDELQDLRAQAKAYVYALKWSLNI